VVEPLDRSGQSIRLSGSVQDMKRPTLAALAVLAAGAAVPASASAASIALTVPGGVPTIAYTAADHEVNALEMHGTVNGPFDFRMPFFEYSAPVTVGAGCSGTFPILCGAVDKAFPVTVSLLDRDDVAKINSFTGSVAMDAGTGDDDVFAGGIDARADGGGGSDVMVLAANGTTTGNGGTGNDRVAAGLGAAAAILTGDSGNDLLVPDGFAFDNAKGGTGNDRLVSFSGDDVTLSGESGADVLAAQSGHAGTTLDGGTGKDTIFSHVGGATVDAGADADVIDVRGDAATAADTVTCGSGFDLVWANSADSVAGDCEIVIRGGTPPTLRRVTSAVAAAQALLAHRPDPSAVKK
jgi:Ca2+-binding RTX toxin-like protein